MLLRVSTVVGTSQLEKILTSGQLYPSLRQRTSKIKRDGNAARQKKIGLNSHVTVVWVFCGLILFVGVWWLGVWWLSVQWLGVQ